MPPLLLLISLISLLPLLLLLPYTRATNLVERPLGCLPLDPLPLTGLLSRELPQPLEFNALSPLLCQTQCGALNFVYGGVASGNACYCGNDTVPAVAWLEQTRCQVSACASFPEQKCGGPDAVQILLTSVGEAFYNAGATPTAVTTTPATTGSASASSPSPARKSTDTATISADQPDSQSIGIGVAIGVTVLLVPGALAAVIIFALRRRRRRQRYTDGYDDDDDSEKSSDDGNDRVPPFRQSMLAISGRISRMFASDDDCDTVAGGSGLPRQPSPTLARDGSSNSGRSTPAPSPSVQGGHSLFLEAYRRANRQQRTAPSDLNEPLRPRYIASWVDPRLSQLSQDTDDRQFIRNSAILPPPPIVIFNGKAICSVESFQDSMDYAPPLPIKNYRRG